MARVKMFRRPQGSEAQKRANRAWGQVQKFHSLRRKFIRKERVKSSSAEINQIVARLRRGQVFAISWSTPREDAGPAGRDHESFGLFLVDWFLDHHPKYNGPVKRLMGVRGFLVTADDQSWPSEWRMVLDVIDIRKIERIQRSVFDTIWSQIEVDNDHIAQPVGAVKLRSDQGRDSGEETTDDEASAALRYEEKKEVGGFESSFEELPDELERTVVRKFGFQAWLNRCIQQAKWFTSKFRNELTNFYILKDEDRKQVWKECSSGYLVFLIGKRPEDECHFSAYGVIRDKITVQADRWNDYRSQHLLAFSGAIVYPQAKLGHAHLLVDMQHVLHLMPSLPRVLAQVERALKICQGQAFDPPDLSNWDPAEPLPALPPQPAEPHSGLPPMPMPSSPETSGPSSDDDQAEADDVVLMD